MKATKLPAKQLDLRVRNSVNKRPVQPTTFEGTFVDVARPEARLAPHNEGRDAGVHAASAAAAAARRSHTRTGGSSLDAFHFVAAPNGPAEIRSPERSSSTLQGRATLPVSQATIMAPSSTPSPGLRKGNRSLSPMSDPRHVPPPVASEQPRDRHHALPSGKGSTHATAASPTQVSAQRQVHRPHRVEDVAVDRLTHVGDDGDAPAHAAVASIGRMLLQHSPHRSGLAASHSPTKAPHHLPGLNSPTRAERGDASREEARLDDQRIAEIRQDAMTQAAAINAASYTNRRAAKLVAAARGSGGAMPMAAFGGVDGLLTPAEHDAQGLLNKHALRQARELEADTTSGTPHVQ